MIQSMDTMASAPQKVPSPKTIVLSFLSIEYLEVGKFWIQNISKCNCHFAIVATDQETAEFLSECRVPFIKAIVTPNPSLKIGETVPIGKWSAVTSVKFHIVKELVDRDFNVAMTDIDALILRDIDEVMSIESDILFQRSLYFPRPIAEMWGFAACSGFVCFRAKKEVSRFLEAVIDKHTNVTNDDQVALNLAFAECGVNWASTTPPAAPDAQLRHDTFVKAAHIHYSGFIESLSLSVVALSPDTCWRHNITEPNFETMVVFHPNSARCQNSKLSVFGKYLKQGSRQPSKA